MTEHTADAPPYEFHFVAAPADLEPYLNSLYIWRTNVPFLNDVLPAYSGQLVSFVNGQGVLRTAMGDEYPTSDAFIVAPLMAAIPFAIDGPALAFGVSLNFRGWAAMTGFDVTACHDRMFPAGEGIAPHLAERLAELAEQLRSGAIDETAMLDAMAQIVREGIRPLPDKHQLVIDRTLEWLSASFSPEIAVLNANLPYSERQVQRLVARFFGQTPMRLSRRYRAVRAATLLSLPDLDFALEAEIRDAFYDQAHMIKEIRHFTGRTPRRLLPAAGSVISEMLGPGGYGAVDLFGGNQDQQLGRKPR